MRGGNTSDCEKYGAAEKLKNNKCKYADLARNKNHETLVAESCTWCMLAWLAWLAWDSAAIKLFAKIAKSQASSI
jgi:hypothetical protein